MVKKHKRQRGGFGMMGAMGAMAAMQMVPQLIKQFGGGKKRKKTQKGGLVFPNRRLYKRQRGGFRYPNPSRWIERKFKKKIKKYPKETQEINKWYLKNK